MVRSLAITTAVMMFINSTSVRAEIAGVWAVDDGTKIKADALGHPLKGGNVIFDGVKIKLFAIRNETVAFQLIIEGGSTDTSEVTVSLDSIGPIQNDAAVSNDPDTYFIDRRIELFQQVYLLVDQRSSGLVWQVWESVETQPEAPKGLDGPVPDPLVPLNLLDEPLTVPAGRNQGIWVDVFVPKETPPGTHAGTITVNVSGAPCSANGCQLPVELAVYEATLPDEPAVKTMLYFSGNDPRTVLARYFDSPSDVPEAQRWQIRDRHFKLARRHLVTLFEGQEPSINDDLTRRFSGETFTEARGYYGWGIGRGQDMYSIDTYVNGGISESKKTMWSDWFAANAPSVEYFLYVWDEPGSGRYDQLNDLAAAAKPVPSFVTVVAKNLTALSELDILCVLAEYYDLDEVAAAKAAGHRVWAYNGMRPFSGTFAIDDVAVSPRVNPWIQVKHDIPRWFYWEATHYEDYQGTREQIDVWNNPLNYSNGADWVNGDGLLFFPGRDYLFPSSDLGFDGPLPSIRLKNWRRGLQDAGYLKLARDGGQGAAVDAAIAALIPSVLGEKDYNQPVEWVEDGERWFAERAKLAALIAESPPPADGSTPVGDGGVGPFAGDGASNGGGTVRIEGGCAVTSRSGGIGILVPLLLLLLLLLLAVRAFELWYDRVRGGDR